MQGRLSSNRKGRIHGLGLRHREADWSLGYLVNAAGPVGMYHNDLNYIV